MNKKKKGYGFDSMLVHSERDEEEVSATTPIYATASYMFDSPEEAAELFSLEREGDIYSRISNPTTREFENRMANIEKGVGAVATSSGMGAISLLTASLVEKGENIVSSSKLYGGTYNLFTRTLPNWGVKTKLFDDVEEVQEKIDEDTKFVHVETIGNPTLEVPDFQRISKIAHRNGIPLVVDNTFATPYLCNPIEHGADIVWQSTTKWINGHGNAIGGIVIDSGNFDWKNSKFDALIEPDESYHGLSFVEKFDNEAFVTHLRAKSLRNFGACPSPFNSFLNIVGLETLSLRMKKHCDNTECVVEYLQDHEKVKWVTYPKLENHVSHQTAKKYLDDGYGAVLTFGVQGGHEAGKRLIRDVDMISFSANVGDSKSLIIHPSSTTHKQLTKNEKIESGITDDLIRLSVGLEDPDDIKSDLEKALEEV